MNNYTKTPGLLERWLLDAKSYGKTNHTGSVWHLLADFDHELVEEFLLAVFVMAMFALMLVANSKHVQYFTEHYIPRYANICFVLRNDFL
jgi:hypothetical protein